MYPVRVEILDASAKTMDPKRSFMIMTTVHAVYYSEARQAILLPCTDGSVLLKKMSREFYSKTAKTCPIFRDDAATKVSELTSLGVFLRASSMLDVDGLVTARKELYDQSACNWDSFPTPSISRVSEMSLP